MVRLSGIVIFAAETEVFRWRGVRAPLFITCSIMITKGQIDGMLAIELECSPVFVVKVDVNTQNDIRVLVDNDEGISIRDCVKVSRFIEGSFDREVEDYSLQVSSPGADHPLAVKRQYFKNVGREVAVHLLDGEKVKGLLEKADDEGVSLYWTVKEAVEGRKSKVLVEKRRDIKYEEIKETKVVISFK